MFSATTSLNKSIEILNQLDSTRTPALLSRIFQNLHNQTEKTFNDEELTKLQTAFSLSPSDLDLAIETTEFIFLQAAYHAAKPATLTEELRLLKLNEDKVTAVVELWSSGGRDLVIRLRQLSVAPHRLTGINWQLGLEMSESRRANVKQPTSFWEFRISEDSSSKAEERLQVEFTHEQLYDFYNQLETIQTQIDDLS